MTTNSLRQAELSHVSLAHYRQALGDVHVRLGEGRAARPTAGLDVWEQVDADVQRTIAVTLLEATSDRIARTAEALTRLDAGTYGFCVACAGAIAERRLRALPFAVPCHPCERQREIDQADTRARDVRRAALHNRLL